MQYSIRNAADIGAAIRGTRNQAEMTQAELAQLAGISRPYLAQIEGGRTSRLLDLLLDLMRLLDLELIIRRRTSPDA